ncbi:hypothetical protein, partial [Dickeya dianthicola]|uniref:hypothetical protein n=1 Tax=Dickeya dianthicola TaxID=204039 RepID=UPI000558F00B
EYFTEHPAMSGLKISKEILEKFNGTIEQTEVNTITIDTLISHYDIIPDLNKNKMWKALNSPFLKGAKNHSKLSSGPVPNGI